jgi:hypothetical protein
LSRKKPVIRLFPDLSNRFRCITSFLKETKKLSALVDEVEEKIIPISGY